MGSSKRRQSWV